MTDAAFMAFLLVFVRCSAMFATCPVFSSQSIPVQVRVFTTAAVSGALAFVIRPELGPPPSSLYELIAAAMREALSGVLIGSLVNLAMQGIQMAGSMMDLQSGLGQSQALNPMSGVTSSVISQFKSMLAVVIFLTTDAHHLMIQAFVRSYHVLPAFGQIQQSFFAALEQITVLSLQIAAPVMACGFVVDAALALLARAVPQMPAMMVGMPAKIGVGVATIAIGIPMTVAAVNAMLGVSFNALAGIFRL
jgi:flagellar biosynthesis protein FliR